MAASKKSNEQDKTKNIEAPAPTIVGPRPDGAAGASISVPRGMEKLLTLAGLNEDWREKTLADPLSAAAEANIPLSPTESAILMATPPKTLAQMILSFVRTRLSPLRNTAITAGTAAAALLATTDYADSQEATKGIRPDTPTPPSTVTRTVPDSIQWQDSVEAALARAAASNRAVFVVCPYGVKWVTEEGAPPGSAGMRLELPSSRFLEDLCSKGNDSIEKAVVAANLIAVKLPVLRGKKVGAYLAMLQKQGVAAAAPLVFFLAPDGTVLHRDNGADEAHVVGAIEAVPPLLAKWIAERTPPPKPAPPATKGHTKM
ncbi:MAG: hypothetical protein AB1696_14105 [Planctomycetota bacterium]